LRLGPGILHLLNSHHVAAVTLCAQQQVVSRQLLVTLPIVLLRLRNQRRHAQQFPAAGEVFRTVPVAEKTIVADALETVWGFVSTRRPCKTEK
jgi:hypothetical protein